MWPFRKRKPGSTALVALPGGRPSALRGSHNAVSRELATLTRERKYGIEVPRKQGKHAGELVPDWGALVASGRLITHGQANYLRRLIQPWQIRSFGYYDLVGEIKYAAQFYARALSNLTLHAAEIDENGDLVPTDDDEVKAAVDRIRDPGSVGRKGLLADYGRLMFLTGEALLFVWHNPETDMEQWEMLSTDELRALDGDYTRFMAPSLPAANFQPMPDDAYVPVPNTAGRPKAVAYRLWKRHPRFSALPDAPMEGVLELCEELVLLTHAVRARAMSRLAGSGILFVDDRITTRPQEATPDDDILEDPFLADLTESMTLPITDQGTAEAVVPMVARVHVPDNTKIADLVYHLQLVDPMQLYPETNLRMECVRRIAICLDMPPEMLLGLGNLNHWNVWGIDEQSWKYHLQPMADHLVADLTSAYLTPYLKNVLGRSDWDKFVIDYDAAKVINHPDRSKDYFQAHAVGVIGDEALREAIGATEDDVPTQEEMARIIGLAVKDASLAWFGTPAPRGGAVETAPGEITSDQPGDVDVQPAQSTGASVEKGPPPGGPNDDAVTSSALVAGAESWGMFALLRARESAGAKVLNQIRRRKDLQDAVHGVRAGDVAATLGRDVIRQLNLDAAGLLLGARPLILDVLAQFGCDQAQAEAISNYIERHAARTLFDLNPQVPPQFRGVIERMLRQGD